MKMKADGFGRRPSFFLEADINDEAFHQGNEPS
jgi:hypothetical protein